MSKTNLIFPKLTTQKLISKANNNRLQPLYHNYFTLRNRHINDKES